jgi:heat shock protein HtpX
MSFSFIEIESRKSKAIAFAFTFIILVYFFTAYLLLLLFNNFIFLFFYGGILGRFSWPSLGQVSVAASVAFAAAYIHFAVSTINLIPNISRAVGSRSIDPQDTYHQYLKRIVEEVSVAIGGIEIEPMVIPTFGMNAFSMMDFKGRAVIGVTEGLLARLSRPQIEAVVAHEAGHIASGDCLTATVVCSLAEIYEAGLCRLKSMLGQSRGRGSLVIALVYIILAVTGFLSRLLRCFLSREREFRADATAVRLCRNPLSLAEALKLISRNWRGEGADGESIQSIFIINPRFSELDEREGIFSDMFSTHPPVKNRLEALLSMVHLDENTLEQNLKNFKRVSPVVAAETSTDGPVDSGACPNCKTALEQINYEGAPVLKCRNCAGVLADNGKVPRIFIRQDYAPSQEIIRLGKLAAESMKKFHINQLAAGSAWVIDCPKCKSRMHRQFFNYSYPVEIDKCPKCEAIWLDKDELGILQYIYENKDNILY